MVSGVPKEFLLSRRQMKPSCPTYHKETNLAGFFRFWKQHIPFLACTILAHIRGNTKGCQFGVDPRVGNKSVAGAGYGARALPLGPRDRADPMV